jgi:PP-loop superfamily ATP-utilizing enzyme
MVAATRPVDARRILAGLGATVGDGGRVDVAWSGGEASVVVGSRAPKEVRVGGAAFRGPVVRVAYVAADRSEVAGERLTAVDGIVTLARPGIVSVARDGAGVVASVESGITLDESWTGRPLVRLASRLGIGEWDAPIRLARPNVVPDDLVRRLARRYGTRLVTIRLEPEGSDR